MRGVLWGLLAIGGASAQDRRLFDSLVKPFIEPPECQGPSYGNSPAGPIVVDAGICERYTTLNLSQWYESGPIHNVTFNASDNIDASGIYFEKDSDLSAPWVVLVHGYGGCPTRYDMLMAMNMLRRRNFNVLAIQRRQSGSHGWGGEDHHDVVGAVRWVQKRAPDARVGLFGISMGALTVLRALTNLTDVSHVWLESPFDTQLGAIHDAFVDTIGGSAPKAVLPVVSFLSDSLASQVWRRMRSRFDVLSTQEIIATIPGQKRFHIDTSMWDRRNPAKRAMSLLARLDREGHTLSATVVDTAAAQPDWPLPNTRRPDVDRPFNDKGCRDHATTMLYDPDGYSARLGAFFA